MAICDMIWKQINTSIVKSIYIGVWRKPVMGLLSLPLSPPSRSAELAARQHRVMNGKLEEGKTVALVRRVNTYTYAPF
jgi:hypothetical protein